MDTHFWIGMKILVLILIFGEFVLLFFGVEFEILPPRLAEV